MIKAAELASVFEAEIHHPFGLKVGKLRLIARTGRLARRSTVGVGPTPYK